MSAFNPRLLNKSAIARPKWMALFVLGFFVSVAYYAALAWLVFWLTGKAFGPLTG